MFERCDSMTTTQYLLIVFILPCILQLIFGFIAKNRIMKFLPLEIFAVLFLFAILEFLGVFYFHFPTTGGIISADVLDFVMINGLPMLLSLGVGILIVWAVQDNH